VNVKVVCALIAAAVSALGIGVNVVVLLLERKKFRQQIELDREKLAWERAAFLMGKMADVTVDTHKELFRQKVDCYRLLFERVAAFNDKLRRLLLDWRTISERGESTSLLRASQHMERRFLPELRSCVSAVLELNVKFNISFSEAAHRYMKDYWLPSCTRLLDELASGHSTFLTAMSRQPGPHDSLGGAFNPQEFLAVVEQVVHRLIDVNRDLREELASDMGNPGRGSSLQGNNNQAQPRVADTSLRTDPER
jgi:hypothetical protein